MAQKNALWNHIGEEIGWTSPEVHRWFNSQRTRYGKLTSKMKKSALAAYQLTGRVKWVLTHFGFLQSHILRKASKHTADFYTNTSTLGLDESRGLGTSTDMESMLSMDTSMQALSQQPSFSAATTSTPAQSQDPRFYELFQQNQSLLSDFMKDCHRKPLAYSQTLYKHTGHTLKIFENSSDMANKIEKIFKKMKEL